MSINPEKLIIKPLRPQFAELSNPKRYHNGNTADANQLHHQTVANIAKAVLEYAYGLENTRVFFDILGKHETCLTFDIPMTDVPNTSKTAINPNFKAVNQFIGDISSRIKDKDGLTIVEIKRDSDTGVTSEAPLLAYDIREILPAMRQIAADKMDHCQNNKMWLCSLINDLQIELRRDANKHLPEFNI